MSNEVTPVVDATVTAAPEEAKAKKKRNRKPGSKGRSKGTPLAAPEGGWKTADDVYSAGFVARKHSKPKPTEFSDVLEAARFDVRYYKGEVERAEKRVEELAALGTTPEERKSRMQTQKIVDSAGAAMLQGTLTASQIEQLALILAAAQAKAATT